MKLLAVLVLLGLACQVMAVGTITVSFSSEDPTGASADSVLNIGESIEATITLNPAPQFPIRLDIVSTLPSIVFSTHDRLAFNPGQATGTITLQSPANGDVGFSNILVEPETFGLYSPLSFTVLVQGVAQLELVSGTGPNGPTGPSNCIGAGRTATFGVRFVPAAAQSVTIQPTATNGDVSEVTVVNGQSFGTFQFNGTAIGPSTISISSELYGDSTISFEVSGTIVSTHSTPVAGVPIEFTVSTLPTPPVNSASIAISPDNGVTDVSSVIVSSSNPEATFEYIAQAAGPTTITFSANSYCNLEDTFTVSAGPNCLIGFVADILGDSCRICPGNVDSSCATNDFSNACNLHGGCTFSRCNEGAVRCECDEGFEGHACEWSDVFDFQKADLDASPLSFSLSDVTRFSDDIVFTVPGNLIAAEAQVGTAYLSQYDDQNPVFGSVDPTVNAPANTFYTGLSFVFETVCNDNTEISDVFANDNAIDVLLPIELSDDLDESSLARLFLYYYDLDTCTWIDGLTQCSENNQIHKTDLLDFTVTTAFCRPGQYALYEVGVVVTDPNTGSSQNPNPDQYLLSGDVLSTTGQTGFAVVPPTPQPSFTEVQPVKPSPPKPDAQLSLTSSDASVVSSSLLVVAIAVAILAL